MKLTVLFFVCALLFAACSESTAPDSSAEKMSLQSLQTSLGYDWFPREVSLYEPDTAKVRQIMEAFNPATDMIYFFVNPSCGCKGTQKLFPQTMRILTDAAIQEPLIEIYSMRSYSDSHPHMDRMSVKRLPTIFIVRNGAVLGSFSEQSDNTKLEDMILNVLRVQ